MIDLIANNILRDISNLPHNAPQTEIILPYANVTAGVVDTVEVGNIKMPVSNGFSGDLKGFASNPLVPNTTSKGIVYFEDSDEEAVKVVSIYEKQEISNLRLVIWINKERNGIHKYQNIFHQLKALVLNNIKLQVNSPMVKYTVEHKKTIKGAKVFQRYDYSNITPLLSFPPFFSCAFDFLVKYTPCSTSPLVFSDVSECTYINL